MFKLIRFKLLNILKTFKFINLMSYSIFSDNTDTQFKYSTTK